MEALKPCPFCGGDAELERAGDRHQSTIYACLYCSCRLETGEEWGYGTNWNTRAPDPRIAELEARAERAEAERAEEWRKRRKAESDRDLAKAVAEQCKIDRDQAEAELARLRAAGAFNEGIEAATRTALVVGQTFLLDMTDKPEWQDDGTWGRHKTVETIHAAIRSLLRPDDGVK